MVWAPMASIFGNPDLFSAEKAVILPIKLPVGNWQLAAVPAAGWGVFSISTLAMRFFSPFIALLISLLLFALLNSRYNNRQLALHDPLTRLTNRRYFDQFLQQNIAITQRNRGRFVLMYLDLNDFKPVNDQYGHKKGDLVLTIVAQRLRDVLRDSDMISRIGGDEFVIILPSLPNDDGVNKVVEKIRQTICQPIDIGNRTHVTIGTSIGTSSYPDDGLTADALLHKADQAMYADKLNR